MQTNHLASSPRRRDWLLVLIPAVTYLAFALPNIQLPGVYYDEVLQVLPAMYAAGYNVTPDYVIMSGTVMGFGRFSIPLMTTSYLGSLQAMLFVPIFLVLPPTMITIRLTFITLGLISIILAFFWSRQLLGSRGALIASLLLATDASYILFTRADNGPVNTMMVIKLGMLIAFTYWWQRGSKTAFFMGAFLAGLGIYDKVNFIWFLGAGGLAVIVFGYMGLWERVRGRLKTLAIGGVLFILGGLPFFGYVVLTGGGPFRDVLLSFNNTTFKVDNSQFLENLGYRLDSFNQFLTGYAALNSYTTNFLGVQVPFDRSPFTFQPWIFVLAIIVPILLFLTKRLRLSPLLRFHFALTLTIVVIILMSAVTLTTFSFHHMVIIYPLQYLLIANCALLVFDTVGRWGQYTVLTIVGITIAINAAVAFNNQQALAETEGSGMWSAAIYDLNDYLLEQGKPVFCMDWGICHNLQVLSQGELKTSDAWQKFLAPFDAALAEMQAIVENSDDLYVFHSPEYTGLYVMVDTDHPREMLFAAAHEKGLEAKQVKTINQANGDVLFEIYQVTPENR